MRILVTNDDGVHAPGLRSLVAALKPEGEVAVVAPDRDQSGIGTATTLLTVVRAEEISPMEGDVKTFAVQGTPADCVILATEKLFDEPFDLVVSGINQGSNVGLDVMTSGTVGGAFQGYSRDIPTIAVSVASLTDVLYQAAASASRALAHAISRNSHRGPLFLNVNLPNLPPDRIERVEITRVGPRAYLDSVEQGGDVRRSHYWIRHNKPTGNNAPSGTDVWAVRNNRVSITPLHETFASEEVTVDLEALVNEVATELGLGGHG